MASVSACRRRAAASHHASPREGPQAPVGLGVGITAPAGRSASAAADGREPAPWHWYAQETGGIPRVSGGAAGRAGLRARSPRPRDPEAAPAAPARFGFTVTKEIGGAVVRNRIRRRLRALTAASARRRSAGLRLCADRPCGRPRPPFTDLKKDLERAFQRVHHAAAQQAPGARTPHDFRLATRLPSQYCHGAGQGGPRPVTMWRAAPWRQRNGAEACNEAQDPTTEKPASSPSSCRWR